MNDHSAVNAHRRPISIRDWLLLVIALLFSGAAAWEIVSGPDWRTGVITLVMSLGGVVLFGARIVRRMRQNRRADLLGVAIAGSRDFPMARGRMLAMVGAVGLFGAVGLVLGESMPPLLRVTCGGLAVFALGMTVALLCGWIPNPVLRFEPEGLVVQRGAKRRYSVAWDNIADMSVGELARNPMILLYFHDPAAITLGPQAVRRLVEREIGQTRGLYGGDLLIAPRLYGLDDQLLAAALRRYIEAPAARSELAAWTPVTQA